MTLSQTVAPAGVARAPAAAPSERSREPLSLIVFLLTAAAIAVNVRWLMTPRSNGRLITNWVLAQYWLGYEHGFTRRGLPGQVLSWFVGGSPTYSQAKMTGLMLSLLALLSIVGLAVSLIRRRREATLLAAAVVFTSPFAAPLIVHDLFRYDAVGIIVLFLMANGFLWRTFTSPWATAAISGLLMLIATASEEFLAAYLLPVALLRVLLACRPVVGIGNREWWRPRDREWGPVLLTFGPSLVLFLASDAARPSAHVVNEATRDAVAHKVLGGVNGDSSALSALSNGLGQEVRFVLAVGVIKILVWMAILLALYVASAAVIHQLLPEIPSPQYWLCAGWAGGIAVVLSWVGVDDRRWWGLAFLTVAAVAVILQAADNGASDRPQRRSPPRAAVLAGVALLLVALPASNAIPIFLT